jgi:lysophospholipase L1-like esterase
VVACVAGVAIAEVVATGSSGKPTVSAAAHPRVSRTATTHRHRQRSHRQRSTEPRHSRQAPSKKSEQAPSKTNAGPRRIRSARTSCNAVVHIGDSTSEGLDSPDYLPDRAKRIGAQYARVGAGTWRPKISGARSIVETLAGQTNAYDVARDLVRHGYQGCWVLALGTNDAADVAVGSSVDMTERIERMMSAIGNQPVMWVNVKSLLGSSAYAEANMERWNAALVRACPRFPNMRVFDWAAVVRDGWFIDDGIHYTSAGYAARARLIADALAQAFPASGGRVGCVVR